MEEDEASAMVRDLVDLRDSIDARLSACLKRLKGVGRQPHDDAYDATSALTTPSIQPPPKRLREDSSEASTSQIFDGLPCRTDLSLFVQLIKQECLIHHQEAESTVGRKRRPSYPYGNYPFYYSYRLKNASTEDPRLKCFKKEWFQGKDWLDIGCHNASFTLDVVIHFTPNTTTAVEIDASLCEAAEKSKISHIKRYKRNRQEIVHSLTQTRFLNGGILDMTGGEKAFDVVTCLSVCKWIHFHHGDEGMRRLFRSIGEWLRDDGILIVEPQSRRSYSQAMRKQDLSGVPYPLSSLHFDPEDFVPFLINEQYFRQIDVLSADDASKGFDRPIHILQKTQPSQSVQGPSVCQQPSTIA